MQTSDLLEAGFEWVGDAPIPSKQRPKAYGFMWDARGRLVKGNVTIHMKMWYHGGSDSPSLDKMSIGGIECDDKYYDIYWYAFITDSSIWVHKTGWFGKNSGKEEGIWKALGGKPNYNWQRSKKVPVVKLSKLGFRRIV